MLSFLSRQQMRARELAWQLGGRDSRLLGLPRLVQVEVTSRCDLFCRTCTRQKLPNHGDMAYDNFARIVEMLGPVDRLWLAGQGESLLHPDLPRMVRLCARRGLTTTVLHTNGMHLEGNVLEALADAGLGELRVSVDGGAAAEVEYLRDGVDLARVLRNAAAFTRRSSTPVAFYSILNRMNHASMPLLPALAAGAGIRRIFATETVPFRDGSTEQGIYDRREYQFASLPEAVQKRTLAALRRAAQEHGVTLEISLRWERRRCRDPMRRLYLDTRGNATPCCRIHHEALVGNVLQDGLAAVWHGTAMTQWREGLLDRAQHPRVCVERCNLGVRGPR
jgi:MoaA/NifB/PqqE/SkfB family radical SAM enzyme